MVNGYYMVNDGYMIYINGYPNAPCILYLPT